jgi:hypothetical protein
MAVATGVRAFLRLFGSTLGLAVAAALVGNGLRSALPPLGLSAAQEAGLLDDPTSLNGALGAQLSASQHAAVLAGYTKGFRDAFRMTLACELIALVSAVFLIGQHDLGRAGGDKETHESHTLEDAEAADSPARDQKD